MTIVQTAVTVDQSSSPKATLLARASTTLTVALAVAVVRRQALRKFDDDNCGHQSEWRAGHSL